MPRCPHRAPYSPAPPSQAIDSFRPPRMSDGRQAKHVPGDKIGRRLAAPGTHPDIGDTQWLSPVSEESAFTNVATMDGVALVEVSVEDAAPAAVPASSSRHGEWDARTIGTPPR